MPVFYAPTKDQQFILHDVLDIANADIPGYEDLDRDFTQAILGEAGRIAEEVLAPLNKSGDEEGCSLKDGVVTVPNGFKEAYDTVCEGGWVAMDAPEEFGGQNMPQIIHTSAMEPMVSANMAFNMYPGLSHGAMNAIMAVGSDEQKATYLPKMVTGEWSGTMNLTEPHCGTDLGLIRTKAVPQEDGTYKISGQKIWISAGEHEMTKNIVHLVLAKIPGGPDGVKGISLFIVPKYIVNKDGTPGARNTVSCGGLEKKMGIHGNATCVINHDESVGYLIGEENRGMRGMFVMMNEARLGVGLQGYAQGAVAYQNALAWAQDRIQGRAVTGVVEPEKAADTIMVHPDVRRNLMHQKSFVEGARMLTYWGAMMLDRAHRNDDQEADDLISLLTPVMKGFCTDMGFETTVLAQQTLGGSGFTQEWGLEQFVRDARITMIYEGTNGVQSLDLVGRKLPMKGGKPLIAFFDMVKTFIKENEGNEAFDKDFLTPLKAASKDLQAAGMYFMSEGMKSPNNALAGSYDF
ncbi:MAG: acyl-CoA dehydrogenase family protein, partial [Planktomarina sp.]